MKRRQATRSPSRPAKAFTLIELLIVVGIMPVITIGAYRLSIDMRQARARVASRMNANDDAILALTRWRSDVLASSGASVSSDGATMTIERVAGDGSRTEVIYSMAPSSTERGGELRRAIATRDTAREGADEGADGIPESSTQPDIAILARSLTSVRFTRKGRSFGMELVFVFEDGYNRLERKRGGYATPALHQADEGA